MSNARLLAGQTLNAQGYKNWILNGAFDIWQRGTSFPGTFNSFHQYYSADRWQFYRAGGAAGGTISQIAYNGPNALRAARIQRDSGNTGTQSLNLGQSLESIDVYMLKGKEVTLSFRYLTGANFSASTLNMSVIAGTGTDGSLSVGFTGSSTAATKTCSPSTTQRQESITFTVPSNASQLGILFGFNPTGTAGAADFAEITNIQLEVGNQVTAYERKPYALELMLCQRYFEKSFYRVDCPLNTAATYGSAMLSYKVTKRTTCSFFRENEQIGGGVVYNSIQHDLNTASVIYNCGTSAFGVSANLLCHAELY